LRVGCGVKCPYLLPGHNWRAMVLGFAAFAAAAASAATPLSDLWITDSARLGASVLRIDVASGVRTLIDLDDYPNVLGVRAGVRSAEGPLYLEAVNAAQLSTVIRFDPASGQVAGISGFVDGASASPRGSGPDFQPGLSALVIGPWGYLYGLRRDAGPMAVDIATGDRRVISQSKDPPVGEGADLSEPLDLVVERSGSILVADRFAGLVRIDPASGNRETGFVFPDLIEGPHRIERLPDGRVLHAFGAGDGRLISVFDRSLRVESELSGPSRGAGPELLAIGDLVVAPDGSIFVHDFTQRAVIAVAPATGDRRVIAEDPEGADLGLLSAGARFVGFAVSEGLPSPRQPARRVGAVVAQSR